VFIVTEQERSVLLDLARFHLKLSTFHEHDQYFHNHSITIALASIITLSPAAAHKKALVSEPTRVNKSFAHFLISGGGSLYPRSLLSSLSELTSPSSLSII
jgi:hypothetical protein